VLEGVEKLVPPRGVGVVAFGALRFPEGVVPVRRPQVVALEIVAAGAEAVLPIEEDEPVVGAVVEMAGAAVALPHGQVDVALREALDFSPVTGEALAVDAHFEFRRGDDRGGDRGRVGPGGEGGDGCRGRGQAVTGIAGRPMTADTALAAVGRLPELELQAGDTAAVERLPHQLRPSGGVNLMTVAAGESLVRGTSPGIGSALDVKAVDVCLPAAEGRSLLCA
jgi:hypothetical protein